MDYGKLAYLKAVDLEGRSLNNGISINYLTLKNVAEGECEIADLMGGGDVAVFINSSAEATFYHNGEELVTGKNVFFKVSGGGKITAKSDVTVERLDLMVLGGKNFMFRTDKITKPK